VNMFSVCAVVLDFFWYNNNKGSRDCVNDLGSFAWVVLCWWIKCM